MNEGAHSEALAEFLRRQVDADSVRIDPGRRLVGGAIQVNQAFTAEITGGALAGIHELVMRLEAPSSVPESRPLDQQFALLSAARAAGVTVPEPIAFCADTAIFGAPFYLMRRVAGDALGSRVVRSGPHPEIARQLAGELARIHTIVPPRTGLEFLELPRPSPALDGVGKYRDYLDREPAPHPVLEWGLRWLEVNAPRAGEIVLAHHDFRTGNYMIDDGKVTGVLDWEFAGWSDPHEDIGWFCAACWRFGRFELGAGGIAERDEFYAAYEAASGRTIDRSVIPYWETMAHVRWAVIALQQADRHISGRETSLELALIGRKLAELEIEILRLTEGV